MSLTDLQNRFLESVGTSDHPRFKIYRQNRVAVRVRALETLFPKCVEVVGEDAFSAVARDYANQNPCTVWSLDLEGSDFAAHWEKVIMRPGYEQLGYLPELAGLERTIHDAYIERQVFGDEPELVTCPRLRTFHSEWSLISIFEPDQEHVGWLVITIENGAPKLSAVSIEEANVLNLCQQPTRLETLFESDIDPTVLNRLFRSEWLLLSRDLHET